MTVALHTRTYVPYTISGYMYTQHGELKLVQCNQILHLIDLLMMGGVDSSPTMMTTWSTSLAVVFD